MRSARPLLLALAAGLVLADASVVTLALPDLLVELHTSVEGVAAVIGAYTVVLALALLPAARLARRLGPAPVAAAGFAIFALASLACGAAGTLGQLLVARCVQAAGGAGALVAAFSLLVGPGEDRAAERRLWLGTAVLSTAVGPALGGALTEAFSWHAIFWAQAPIAALAAAAAWRAPAHAPGRGPAEEAPAFSVRAALGLALISAALTAVLFLLVLLLVAGWSVSPLRAAAAVLVIPLGALAGSRVGGEPRARAAAGCVLVGGGTAALGFLPAAHLAWTLLPGALAGVGMGLALPALGGDLLPERDARDAARLLTIRHAGIAVALAVLAPVVSGRLDDATFRAQERGVALVLDAKLPPQDKLSLAPVLLAGVDDRDPRAGLHKAIAEHRDDVDGEDRAEFDRLAERADDTLVTAVGEAFGVAFAITAALALLGAVCLLPRRVTTAAGAALLAAVVVAGGYVLAHRAVAPDPVVIADPCGDRDLPETGGITGFLQDRGLELLDTTACRLGSSREELVLALADGAAADRFRERHGTDPRDVGSLLSGLLGG
ncbi:MAG: MFS transporter [Solirubrobacteraceae bacterium]